MKKYIKRGVSASKTDVHTAIKNIDKGIYPNAFCKVLPSLDSNDNSKCMIMHADTAGSKTSLAYIYWKETGDLSVWEGIVQDAIVMNLDDMACVGITDNIVLSSTIGRNKNKISGDVISIIINSAQKFVDKLKRYGINIYLAGGETADVGDIVRTIDVGYTAFALSDRNKIIENNIKGGELIVGLASFGKSSYENTFNSGIGSNGLTFARHETLSKVYAEKYPESFDNEIEKQYVYSGNSKLTDKTNIEGIDVGKLLLSPTRTFLPVFKEIFEKIDRSEISGIIHNTGGGLSKVMNFVQNKNIIKDNLFPTPEVFKLIQKQQNTGWQEMYNVFNMGQRIEFYVSPELAPKIIQISKSFDIEAQIIGRVEKSGSNKLILKTENGDFF